MVTLLRPQPDLKIRANVRIAPVLSYTAVGKSFVKGDGAPEMPAKPEDKAFARTWWENVQSILKADIILLSQIKLQSGGLDGISQGLKAGKSGASGAGTGGKMVYLLN